MNTLSEKRENKRPSYSMIILIGLLAGIITRLTDLLPADNLWSVSSIATLFGFWIVTTTLVIFVSSSNINAGVNSFLYLFSMSLSFYLLEYILGLFLPQFDNGGFKTSLFMLYSIMSVACGLVGFLLYYWNKSKFSSILYGLPIGGLLAESIGVGIYLLNNGRFLFQLLFNLAGFIIIGALFYKKSSNKIVYIGTVIIISILGYMLFYKPFL